MLFSSIILTQWNNYMIQWRQVFIANETTMEDVHQNILWVASLMNLLNYLDMLIIFFVVSHFFLVSSMYLTIQTECIVIIIFPPLWKFGEILYLLLWKNNNCYFNIHSDTEPKPDHEWHAIACTCTQICHI